MMQAKVPPSAPSPEAWPRAGGRERRAARTEQQQAAQQQSAVETQQATFQRGCAACLEGRGYTVK